MPRPHIDLGPLLGYLSGNKTLSHNPEYGKAPGDVPFTYKGDPSELVANPYNRPSALEAYGNPQLMSEYNKFAYAPAEAQQREALAAQYFQPQLEREQMAQQATREAAARFGDSRFSTDLNQDVTRQTALGDAAFNQKMQQFPDLTRAQSEAELAAQKAANEIKHQQAVSHWAKIRSTGYLPATHTALSDDQLAALYPDGNDFSKLASESEAAAGNVYGTPQLKAQRLAGLSQAGVDALPNDRATVGLESLARRFTAQYGVQPSQLGNAPSLFSISEQGVSPYPNPNYTPEAVRNYRESMGLVKELGGNDTPGARLAQSLGLSKLPQASNTIPITPNQVTNGFPNGKPVTMQSNTPSPNIITRPTAANMPDFPNPASWKTPDFLKVKQEKIATLQKQVQDYYKKFPAYAKYGVAPGEEELRRLLAIQ